MTVLLGVTAGRLYEATVILAAVVSHTLRDGNTSAVKVYGFTAGMLMLDMLG